MLLIVDVLNWFLGRVRDLIFLERKFIKVKYFVSFLTKFYGIVIKYICWFLSWSQLLNECETQYIGI